MPTARAMIRGLSNVEQCLAKAAEYAAAGREEDARNLVRRAVSLDPDHPGAQLRWAVELLDRPKVARYHLRRAAELGRGDPAIEYQVACVLLDLGDLDAALFLARRARGHIDEDYRLLPGLVNLTGRLAAAGGHAEVAEEALGLAFTLEPEMAWHGRTLAQFLREQGRDMAALEVARVALRHSPDDPGLRSMVERLRAVAVV
jgi:tetratricopeptide (TPR) repeat protein